MDDGIKVLAQEIAGALLDDYRFKRMLREVVLHVHLEQYEQQQADACQAFFRACDARGISVRMDDRGAVLFTNKDRLSTELRSIYTLYRDRIRVRLERIRDGMKKAEDRQRADDAQAAARLEAREIKRDQRPAAHGTPPAPSPPVPTQETRP